MGGDEKYLLGKQFISPSRYNAIKLTENIDPKLWFRNEPFGENSSACEGEVRDCALVIRLPLECVYVEVVESDTRILMEG